MAMKTAKRPNPPTPFPKREGGEDSVSPPRFGEGRREGSWGIASMSHLGSIIACYYDDCPPDWGRFVPANNLVIALTGASGAAYGLRLLDVLLRAGRAVHLVMSPAAAEVLRLEMDRTVRLDAFDPGDLFGGKVPGPGRLH